MDRIPHWVPVQDFDRAEQQLVAVRHARGPALVDPPGRGLRSAQQPRLNQRIKRC